MERQINSLLYDRFRYFLTIYCHDKIMFDTSNSLWYDCFKQHKEVSMNIFENTLTARLKNLCDISDQQNRIISKFLASVRTASNQARYSLEQAAQESVPEEQKKAVRSLRAARLVYIM